jgi:sterol desaturase/sphingolipid hydroxylase (fatty acid hydroxylase superfamily)
MHWIHHSRRPAEHHSNFGVMISVWDRWFGTYRTGVHQRDIQPGLDGYSKPEDVAMLRFYRIPLDPVEFRGRGY